ncbi:hypothetical protein [Hoeflea poritis]|uniref:Uncharacterized protein n=1 Tax=Hoeflea poritis TaxID=2993659 RepID=A0ABT4VP63_9HYPH|nr:hypothetical protein [Hoeflea poritis]MDA4846414.1 hypothetical protein [Hoeflea poritis]
MVDIVAIKNLIAAETGIAVAELEYVTEELIEELAAANDEDTSDPYGVEEVKLETPEGVEKSSGVYCNSVIIDSAHGGCIRYKRGPRSTPDYGCGYDPYKIDRNAATIRQVGYCSDGRTKFLISWGASFYLD